MAVGCLLCDSQDPGVWKTQLAAQKDVLLEDMGSMGSAGTDRVSTPFSTGHVGMEASRRFQGLHPGSASPFPSARYGRRIVPDARSFTQGQHLFFHQSGEAGGFQEISGASPRVSIPFSLRQVGKEASRTLQELG